MGASASSGIPGRGDGRGDGARAAVSEASSITDVRALRSSYTAGAVTVLSMK